MEEQYPVELSIKYPEKSSRWLALAAIFFLVPKFFLLLPHLIIIYFLGLAGFIAFFVAQIAVLFTGKYPRGLYDFVLGTQRWQVRVNCYFFGLTDQYPPFRLN
ncbi:MAG: DUF4389 domain-containing protein [Parcubacteria group bacterium]|nr:DUF4389 domain-containing protein [Parcubacteria group bacterium]